MSMSLLIVKWKKPFIIIRATKCNKIKIRRGRLPRKLKNHKKSHVVKIEFVVFAAHLIAESWNSIFLRIFSLIVGKFSLCSSLSHVSHRLFPPVRRLSILSVVVANNKIVHKSCSVNGKIVANFHSPTSSRLADMKAFTRRCLPEEKERREENSHIRLGPLVRRLSSDFSTDEKCLSAFVFPKSFALE